MIDHQCNKEADIAVLKQICQNEIPAIRLTLEKIFDRIEGDNGDGLITRMRVVENEITHIKDNIPTWKRLTRLSMIYGGASGGVGLVIFFGVKALIGG